MKKSNKKIICAISLFISSILITSSVLSFTLFRKNDASKKRIVKMGEIVFDDNGKIVFPTLFDEENSSGNYENKIIKISDCSVPDNIKKSNFFNNELEKINEIAKRNIFDSLDKEVLKKEIKISNEYQMFLSNIIPNINIEEGEEISCENLVNKIWEQSEKNSQENIISPEQCVKLTSLFGVNLNKEYNNQCKKNEETTYSWGGGWMPGIDVPPVFPMENDGTFLSECNALSQDLDVRFSLNLSYSIIMPTLIAIEAFASFFSFGLAVVPLIVDITFCALEITNLWLEYVETSDLFSIAYELKTNEGFLTKEEFFKRKNEKKKYLDLFNKRMKLIYSTKRNISISSKMVFGSISFYAMSIKSVISALYTIYNLNIWNEIK